MQFRTTLILFFTALAASNPTGASSAELPCAHSHNDYLQARPLQRALEREVCSIEVDVFLVDGQLLVAHDRPAVRAERTLEATYLDPLLERVRHNGGRVYEDDSSLILLVDIKSAAEPTYARLHRVLERYSEMLTTVDRDRLTVGAVTVIVSGERPRATMESQPRRYTAFDGRLPDLDASPAAPSTFMPLVSANWASITRWRGSGAMPEDARQSLAEAVSKAHSQGKKIRFWATPDLPSVWRELSAAGVDLINTDDLDGLWRFLGE